MNYDSNLDESSAINDHQQFENQQILRQQQNYTSFLCILYHHLKLIIEKQLKGLPKIMFNQEISWSTIASKLLKTEPDSTCQTRKSTFFQGGNSSQHILVLSLQAIKNKFRKFLTHKMKKKHSKSLPWDVYLENVDHCVTPLQPSFKQWHFKNEKEEKKNTPKIKSILHKLKGIKQSKHLRRKSCYCLLCGNLSSKQFTTIDLPGIIENQKRTKHNGIVFNSFNSIYMSALRKNRKDATLIIQSLSHEIENENQPGLIERPPSIEVIPVQKKKRNLVNLSSQVFFKTRSTQRIFMNEEDKKMELFLNRKVMAQESSRHLNQESSSIKQMNSMTIQVPLTPESFKTFQRFNLTSRQADKDKASLEKSKSLSNNIENVFIQKKSPDCKLMKLYSLKSFKKNDKLRLLTQNQLKIEISQLRKVKNKNIQSEIVRDESKALSPYDRNKLLLSLVELQSKKQTIINSKRINKKTLSPTNFGDSPRQLEFGQSKIQILKNVNK